MALVLARENRGSVDGTVALGTPSVLSSNVSNEQDFVSQHCHLHGRQSRALRSMCKVLMLQGREGGQRLLWAVCVIAVTVAEWRVR